MVLRTGIRGRLAEAAEGGVLDDGRHLLEKLDVAFLALSLGDVRQDFQHPLGPLAAGGALAAGFVLAEVHEEAGHVDGAGVLVHDDHAAGTHDGAQFRHLLVIDGGIEVLHGNHAAGGSAELGGLEFLAFGDAAADVIDDGPQGRSHRDFHEADVVHVAGQREDLRPLALFGADAGVPGAAAEDDLPDVGEGFHVVQDARLLPETGDGGEGGPRSGHAAFALDRGHQGRFLAADEGAGALVDLQIEVKAGSQDVLAQQAVFLGLVDGDVQAVDGQRILGPAVDVTLMGADGLGGDDHAFQNGVRVGLQDAAVHEGARVAFVGVAQHVFDVARRGGGELPFHARRETGAAAAAQTRIEDLLDDLIRRHFGQGLGHAGITVPGDVLVDLLRIDEAAVSEDPQILEGEEGDLLHRGDDPGGDGFPVEQSLQNTPLDEVLLHQFGDILGFDHHVDDALRIDDHDGTHGAETVAAGFHQFDFVGQAPFIQFGDQFLFDREASGCMTACSSAEQQMRAKNFHVDFILLHMLISFRPVPEQRIRNPLNPVLFYNFRAPRQNERRLDLTLQDMSFEDLSHLVRIDIFVLDRFLTEDLHRDQRFAAAESHAAGGRDHDVRYLPASSISRISESMTCFAPEAIPQVPMWTVTFTRLNPSRRAVSA